MLPTTEQAEIAAFGAVIARATGTPEMASSRLSRDVQKFRRCRRSPRWAPFLDPRRSWTTCGAHPSPADIAALKQCKPGSCDVAIGTKGLVPGLADQLVGKARCRRQQATGLFNQAIVSSATAQYTQGGVGAPWATSRNKKAAKQRSRGAHAPCSRTRPTSPPTRSRVQRRRLVGLPLRTAWRERRTSPY